MRAKAECGGTVIAGVQQPSAQTA